MYRFTPLNLPFTALRLSEENGEKFVWDVVRQKHVKLEPEEWVRQQMIHYLLNHKSYPLGLMAVEKSLKVNGLVKRTDVVIHDQQGLPKMIIELKAPEVSLDQNVFMQITAYNLSLQVDYLLISNGLEHYCFHLNKEKKKMESMGQIPDYKEL